MEKYDQILTAKSWIIMNYQNGSYMRGLNVDKKRQIASLTKMYTLYGCLQINKQLNINLKKTYIKIIDIVNSGTTANLIADRYILLYDLYYGLMLPSGNDAAALLSYYYGYWLDKQSTFPNLIFSKLRKVDLKEKIKYSNLYTKRFMQYLNDKIIKTQLNHKNTKLQNPHGLSNKFQVSTAWQIAQAAILQIVKTQKYSGFYFNDEIAQVQQFQWHNTNILLKQKGFQGIKTGQTTTAGSCLCSYKSVILKKKYNYEFITVVLGCDDPQKRFSQTRILCDDLENHLNEITY